MSIIEPIYTRHNLGDLDIPFGAFPNVMPFTQRSAVSYQDQLEGIHSWITRTLIPYMVAQSGQETWDANLDRLLSAVDTVLAQQNTDVNHSMNQAIATVIGAHIAFTDPVITGVLKAAQKSLFHQTLDDWYTVTDGRMKDAVTDKPDGPFMTLMKTYFAVSKQEFWTPQWGGDNGARQGDNSNSSGRYQKNGNEISAHARLIFGSSAVFGGGVIVGMNKIGPMETDWSFAEGTYRKHLGNYNYDYPWKLIGMPQNDNELKIFVDTGEGKYKPISVLDGPEQSSEIRLYLHGTFNES